MLKQRQNPASFAPRCPPLIKLIVGPSAVAIPVWGSGTESILEPQNWLQTGKISAVMKQNAAGGQAAEVPEVEELTCDYEGDEVLGL